MFQCAIAPGTIHDISLSTNFRFFLQPALGGSDASCEDEDEEDSEEEEDDEEELASTCGQDADSHDEWGFRGFRANRPLLPPRVMIRAPTSYSNESREREHQHDDDDDLGSMAVEPSSEDEDEERNINVTFTAIPRPSSSPLAMRPPSLPEGSRDRKPMGVNYRTYSNFASSSYQAQGGASTHTRRDCSAMNMTNEGDGMASADTGVGAFVALADVAHGSGPNWLLKGFGCNPTVGFGGRVDVDRDSDESVATSLFVEVLTFCVILKYSIRKHLVNNLHSMTASTILILQNDVCTGGFR